MPGIARSTMDGRKPYDGLLETDSTIGDGIDLALYGLEESLGSAGR
jgi:hypothetical protein